MIRAIECCFIILRCCCFCSSLVLYVPVLYLILLHLWTFALLVFHAHNIEPVHGDFGPLHGPGSLMHQQLVTQPISGLQQQQQPDQQPAARNGN